MKLTFFKWIIESIINKNIYSANTSNNNTNSINNTTKEKMLAPSIVNINIDISFDLFNFFKEQLYTTNTDEEIEQIINDINEQKTIKLHYLVKLNYITGEISYWDVANKNFSYDIGHDISLKIPITNKDFPCDWDNSCLWKSSICPHFRIHEYGVENLLVPEYYESKKRNIINIGTPIGFVQSLINYKFYNDNISKIALNEDIHIEFNKEKDTNEESLVWQRFSTESYDEYYEKFVKGLRHPSAETSFRMTDNKYFCSYFWISYYYSPLSFNEDSVFLDKYGLPL